MPSNGPPAPLRQRQFSILVQPGALASSISGLVHMLQCERGASNIWLCSQGTLYAAECKARRAPGAMGFTQVFFSDEMRQRRVDRIDAQQVCFVVFLAHATPDMQATFHSEGLADADIEMRRRLACTRQPAALGERLRCGTGCGSCVPEQKALLAHGRQDIPEMACRAAKKSESR